jgi:hypothetical protein
MTTDVTQLIEDAVNKAEADLSMDEVTEALGERSKSRSGEAMPELSKEMGMTATTKMSPEADEMVTMYSRLDGTPSVVPIYMLPSFLRRRFQSENWIPEEMRKTRVFTLKASEAPTMKQGEYLCDFNPDSPSYAYVNAAGVSHIRCNKSNIPSLFEKKRHQNSYHSSASQAVDEYREITEQGARDDRMASLLERLVEREEAPVATTAKVGRPKKETNAETE